MTTTSAGPGALVDRVTEAAAGTGVTRRTEDRWVTGTCSGIAVRFDLDPIVVRVATITLSLLTGLGVVAYGAAYLLLPAGDSPSPLARARAKGVNPVVLLVLLGVLLVAGVGAAFGGFDSFGSWSGFPVIPVLIGGALLYFAKGHGQPSGYRVGRVRGRRRRPGRQPTSTSTPPPPPAGTHLPSAPRDTRDPGVGKIGPPVLIPTPAGYGPTMTAPGPLGGATPAAASAGPVPFAPQSIPASFPPPPATTQPRSRPAARPLRPKHRRLGVVGTLAGLGAGLAAYGLGVLAHGASGAEGSATPIGLAAALAALAIVLIVAGSLGRRGGLIALLGVPLAIACGANAASGTDVWSDGAGDRVWTPAATTSATYRLGAGQALLDLSRYPQHTSGPTPTIIAHVGFGQLNVLVPADLTVQVDSTIRWGNVSENDTIGKHVADTGGDDVKLTRTYGSGDPDVIVRADVTGGEVAVTRK